ncbi:class I SAM-dependent methyltransferase [Nocardia sp. NBC_00881]|uniref:class I SAM-dependent methyltransferase n=1 Tax=Nocardia sp. NBC_00881 TaxID=2975995 RepID=UPI003869BA00|nr:class I SAM-dependent methyltransferase [Nocardia sp. NBC_00881]
MVMFPADKMSLRRMYDDISRRLAASGVGDAATFLNYGYVSVGDGDESKVDVPAHSLNGNSIRLVLELIGTTELDGRTILDVGCGRGGTVGLIAKMFDVEIVGIDLSPEAVMFCRNNCGAPSARFDVGDAEHLPFEDKVHDVVVNIESSHGYPDLGKFLSEVKRVLKPGGWFLYTDLQPFEKWDYIRSELLRLGFVVKADRDITANVLASRDEAAPQSVKAFGSESEAMNSFLAVPGSELYEMMRQRILEYRIIRCCLK